MDKSNKENEMRNTMHSLLAQPHNTSLFRHLSVAESNMLQKPALHIKKRMRIMTHPLDF